MAPPTVALLPTGFVVASQVASLFGGPPRLRVVPLPRFARTDASGFALSADPPRAGELVIDVVRALFANHAPGNARTAAAIARSKGNAPASPARPPNDAQLFGSAAELGLALARAVAALLDGGEGSLLVPPVVRGDELGAAVLTPLVAGLGAQSKGSEPLATLGGMVALLVDDIEVRRVDDQLARVCGAGQAATLAAGLAPHLVALMLDHGGTGAARVWQDGYDELARRAAILQVERQLLASIVAGEAVCRLGGARSTVFPPLSRTCCALSPTIAAKVERLRAHNQTNPKLTALVDAFAVRARQLHGARDALAEVELEVRVPGLQPAAEWWARQDLRNKLGASTAVLLDGENPGLRAALRALGIEAAPLSPGWFMPGVDTTTAAVPAPVAAPGPLVTRPTVLAPLPGAGTDIEHAFEPPAARSAPPLVRAAKPAARTNGGVLPPAARLFDAPFVDPQLLVIGPWVAGSLRITIDGAALDDAEQALDVVARRGDQRVARLTSAEVAHGAVVCVELDPPEGA